MHTITGRMRGHLPVLVNLNTNVHIGGKGDQKS